MFQLIFISVPFPFLQMFILFIQMLQLSTILKALYNLKKHIFLQKTF